MTEVGYESVLTQTKSSIAQQVNVDFDNDAKFVVTHLVVDTGWPCDPEDNISSCNCDDFIDPGASYNAAQEYTLDDKIISPETPGYEYYAYAQPTSALSDTLINYSEKIDELRHQNNQFNCELLKKGGIPSDNNIIITEVFYDQPQLFGFPIISNPYTDPIPLYSHTAMRLARGSRGSLDNDLETVGPVCDAMPFIVEEETIAWGTEDKLNQTVDILDGNGSSDFGFLAWDPDTSTGGSSAPYLRNELRSSNIPLNDFTNARDDTDHELTVGDWVSSSNGATHTVEDEIQLLIGQKIRIPVWDKDEVGGGYDHGTGGDPDAYKIIGFAWVRIDPVPAGDDVYNASSKTVFATYLGDATNEACANGSASSGTGGNTAPVANDDSTSTVLVAPVIISVLGNDTDADGDTLSVSSVGSPANGLVVDNGNGTVTYTANLGFTGADSFTYTISDGNGGTDTATVTVTVTSVGGNNAPTATDDGGTTDEDIAVTINVLANDTDPDGDTLSVSSVGTASNGTVTDNGDGTVTYTPTSGFSGSDSFTYTISDGNGGTDTATVSITVNAINTNPVANADSGTTDTAVAVTIDLIGNDTDADGDTLSVTSVGSASNGSVVDNGDGTATYTSNGGFSGSDSFTYTISDGNGGTDSATVNITVNAVVQTMHVSNLNIWVTRHKPGNTKWYYRGRIEVTVVDASGNPVQGVSVQGTWSGAVSESDSGTTNSSGVTSPKISSGYGSRYNNGPFTFCVTNLVKSGWTYDSGANSPSSGCVTASY